MIKKDYQIRCIADVKCTLGEGPVWDDKNQVLYWVDIIDKKIYRLNPSADKLDWWNTPEYVGFIVLKKEGGLLAGFKTGLHHVTLKDNHEIDATRIDRVNEGVDYIRFNDGMCDNFGRIWGCTMDMNQKEPLGKFYCYDGRLNRTLVDEGYVVSNGPALSPDGQFLYTVETVGSSDFQNGIYVAKATGEKTFGNKELLISWKKYSGAPDGIITDADGNLWIGEFGGDTVRCYSAGGELRQEIQIPARNITKPVFGGCNRDVLYVTTGTIRTEDYLLDQYPQTGGVFEITGSGGKGQPTAWFAGEAG